MICKGAFKYTELECTENNKLCNHYIPHEVIWDGPHHCECEQKLCYRVSKPEQKYRRTGKCVSEFESAMLSAIKNGSDNARKRKSKKSN